jgi:uncharacterized membrane protein
MDALFDGVFAVAMTLLVLDIRLPDDFHPDGDGQLLTALFGLWPKVMAYLLSFWVLAYRWLAWMHLRSRVEYFGVTYIRWWMFYLLLITCVPFTTIMVGRFASFAPAIWLYAGNTALIAITAWRLTVLTPELEHEHHRRERTISLIVLLSSALLCMAWSFVDPSHALWALTLNLVSPMLVRWGAEIKPDQVR